MFISFFENLRAEKIPVSLREFLAFLESLSAGLATYDLEGFYYLGRTIMVKDEKNLDKFALRYGWKLHQLGYVGKDF